MHQTNSSTSSSQGHELALGLRLGQKHNRTSNEYNEHFVLHSSHNPENDHWLVDDLMGEDYYHYSQTAVVNCSMAGFAFEE